jgi:putative iron-regulated protein
MKAIRNLMIVLLTASGLAAGAATNREIVQNVSRQVILQTYLDLAVGAKNLQAKVEALNADKTEANMAAAQQAWRDARVAWECSESFLFGPVDALGLDPAIDTWPLNRLDLQAVLSSGRTLSLDFVRNLGANLQGFHTIEFLLFGDGITTNQKPVSALSARELEYLRSTSALLVEKTGQLANAWLKNADPDDSSVPGFVDIISRPSLENPYYPTEQAVLIEFTKGIIAILDEVANGKMSDPLGADINSANISLVESPYSWNSLADFTDNIRSVLNVYTGDYGTTSGAGLQDAVQNLNPALATRVEGRIRQAMQKIIDVGGPSGMDYRHAITNPAARLRAQAAIKDLNDLRSIFENEVLPLIEN